MLSVFSTLKESFFLWVRNFWYLVALTLVTKIPIIFLNHFKNNQMPAHAHGFGFLSILGLVISTSVVVIDAAGIAAILGLLRRQSLGKTAVMSVWYSIKTYTWILFRLGLLIGLIAVMVGVCIVGIMHVLGLDKAGLVTAVFYLVFITYALAAPLVVMENLNARMALQRSWEIIKRHFWYVAGCFLFLGLGDWLIHRLVGSPSDSSNTEVAGMSVHLGLGLISSVWVILFWCMYLRIKETEAAHS